MQTRILLSFLLIFAIGIQTAFADYRISQKTTMEDVTTELTIYAKGVRERRESKLMLEGDAEEQEMMARMMPNITEITQCDLKQNVSINEATKAYFIDYYDWSELPPDQLKRRPNQKITIKGTATVSSAVADSGKRQQMFGLTAKWLKAVQSIETSADSCDGKSSVRMEREGWFVDLVLEQDRCPIPQIPGESGGCRPKLIIKAIEDPGFFVEGTTKMFENNKLSSTTSLQTTALSKATLDQGLFEIPTGFAEVDSLMELMQPGSILGNEGAVTEFTGAPEGSKSTPRKTIAIDFFAGNTSKIDEKALREFISSRLTSAGMSGALINSQSDLLTGNFPNVIGVQIKKVKESGASKVGGLFGKVVGNDGGAKLGDSEAEVVVTVFGNDGKTVVASETSTAKVSGKADDAVKAAIERVIDGLIKTIK